MIYLESMKKTSSSQMIQIQKIYFFFNVTFVFSWNIYYICLQLTKVTIWDIPNTDKRISIA